MTLNNFINKCSPRILGNSQDPIIIAELTASCKNIEGDLVECGVFAGGMAAVMSFVCPEKTIHLVDSFEGIPHPCEPDCFAIGEVKEVVPLDGALVTTNISKCTQENVTAFLKEWDRDITKFVFHAGWIEDIIEGLNIEKIALLRIDVDLWRPTRLCLEHLYDKMSPNGVVFVHDYVLPGVHMAVDDFLLTVPQVNYTVENSSIYWRKPLDYQ
jgi:O-methyltransferase